MGKTRNSRLATNLKGVESGAVNSVDTKLNELSIKNLPFDSSNLSYTDSANKYENYLLDKNHKEGGSKAKFLSETLGYNKGDGAKLHKAIGEAIHGKTPDIVTKTNYGTKCIFNTKIKGNDGKYHHANVTVVIQQDNGKTIWRLITITPGKKDQ